jgi:CAAX prenyl protease-like protein
MHGFSTVDRAYIGPFAVFLGCLLFGQVAGGVFEGQAAWPFSATQYWVYPLQTVACGYLLWHYWPHYELRWPRGVALAIAVGVVVFLLWIAPREWLGRPARLEGYEPWFFASPVANWTGLALRFLRLVVIVPLLEEIFWRGYLLRWVINHHFEQVPFGTFQWPAFAVTTVGFCLEHQPPDWPAALLAGALYNVVAFRTRSLAACVLAHALTNLLLGIYVMRTGQWGFW